ncbi:hypothetical protein SDC9_74016 [bioreactor metagenome]|uniref:RelA/SpoT domain-containing protein n=1 Tax=bioreactor metagenome TaxID=1076179 RepID=A0A644YN33_9ZZZZ
MSINLENFLKNNRIDQETWKKSDISWETLEAIYLDHERQLPALSDAADICSRVIQRIPDVHSVRWRIKNSEHLLEKIIRKKASGNEKYQKVNETNYHEIVTDLIGIRALHLFKDDCFAIDSHFRNSWSIAEKPIAYIREGDPSDLQEKFAKCGFEVKNHPAGYRSIHYVISTQPLQRSVFSEIQVRTIFEEGWSEIDHRVRYPNFSDDELVAYFLTIFNRLAGSADEMGTFVQGLTDALSTSKKQIEEAKKQKEDALSEMDKMLKDLETIKSKGEISNQKIGALQKEVAKLRMLNTEFTSLVDPSSRLVQLSKITELTDPFRRLKNIDLEAMKGFAKINLTKEGKD